MTEIQRQVSEKLLNFGDLMKMSQGQKIHFVMYNHGQCILYSASLKKMTKLLRSRMRRIYYT